MPLSKAELYRLKAREYAEAAQPARDAEARAIYERLAEQWEKMAVEAERQDGAT
jgi:hypothetical protein